MEPPMEELLKLVRRVRLAEQNPPDAGEVSGIKTEDLPEESKGFESVERFIGGNEQSLEKLTGISSRSLPNPDSLDETHTDFLYTELLRLLRSYGYEPDFPNGLPVMFKYREIRKIWSDPHPYLGPGTGVFYMEFCEYEPEKCPFPKTYCACRNFEDLDEDNLPDDDDLDDVF